MNCVLEPRYDGTDYAIARVRLPHWVIEDAGQVVSMAGPSSLHEDLDVDVEGDAAYATV